MLDRRRLMLTAAALTVGGAANPALANPSPRDEALAAAVEHGVNSCRPGSV